MANDDEIEDYLDDEFTVEYDGLAAGLMVPMSGTENADFLSGLMTPMKGRATPTYACSR